MNNQVRRNEGIAKDIKIAHRTVDSRGISILGLDGTSDLREGICLGRAGRDTLSRKPCVCRKALSVAGFSIR